MAFTELLDGYSPVTSARLSSSRPNDAAGRKTASSSRSYITSCSEPTRLMIAGGQILGNRMGARTRFRTMGKLLPSYSHGRITRNVEPCPGLVASSRLASRSSQSRL